MYQRLYSLSDYKSQSDMPPALRGLIGSLLGDEAGTRDLPCEAECDADGYRGVWARGLGSPSCPVPQSPGHTPQVQRSQRPLSISHGAWGTGKLRPHLKGQPPLSSLLLMPHQQAQVRAQHCHIFLFDVKCLKIQGADCISKKPSIFSNKMYLWESSAHRSPI